MVAVLLAENAYIWWANFRISYPWVQESNTLALNLMPDHFFGPLAHLMGHELSDVLVLDTYPLESAQGWMLFEAAMSRVRLPSLMP